MSVYETAFSAILSSPSTLFWSTLLHNTVYGSRQVYLTTCFVFGHRPQCYHLTYSIEFQKKRREERKKERKQESKKERKKKKERKHRRMGGAHAARSPLISADLGILH